LHGRRSKHTSYVDRWQEDTKIVEDAEYYLLRVPKMGTR
jgi:hypothetical protein